MKKTVTAICSIALAGVIASGAFIANGAHEKKNAISSQAALEIALKDAGVNQTDALNSKSVLERDGIHYVFDVEFDYDTNEYDYKINAKDGSIIERDTDKNDDVAAITSATTVVTTTAATTATKENKPEKVTEAVTSSVKNETTTQKKADTITLDKAKSIAVAEAKLNIGSVVFTKAKLDNDDGVQEYEIEFTYNEKEYEYTIDAKSGRIIERDVDVIETVTKTKKAEEKTKTSSAYISIESAKAIALKHANLNASDVRFEKVVLDKDDGIYEYEIEFTKGHVEYEYSINAKTGAIIEYDIDTD